MSLLTTATKGLRLAISIIIAVSPFLFAGVAKAETIFVTETGNLDTITFADAPAGAPTIKFASAVGPVEVPDTLSVAFPNATNVIAISDGALTFIGPVAAGVFTNATGESGIVAQSAFDSGTGTLADLAIFPEAGGGLSDVLILLEDQTGNFAVAFVSETPAPIPGTGPVNLALLALLGLISKWRDIAAFRRRGFAG